MARRQKRQGKSQQSSPIGPQLINNGAWETETTRVVRSSRADEDLDGENEEGSVFKKKCKPGVVMPVNHSSRNGNRPTSLHKTELSKYRDRVCSTYVPSLHKTELRSATKGESLV